MRQFFTTVAVTTTKVAIRSKLTKAPFASAETKCTITGILPLIPEIHEQFQIGWCALFLKEEVTQAAHMAQ